MWAGIDEDAFAMALINEYPPGAPIGWHRDAPQYGIVAGVSLLSSCRMRVSPVPSSGIDERDLTATNSHARDPARAKVGVPHGP